MSTGLQRERRTQAGTRARVLLDQLRELLAAVDAGELPAGPAYRHRIEGAITDQVVSAMIGTFYADHLAGRDVDDGWSTRVVEALLDGVAGPAYTRRE